MQKRGKFDYILLETTGLADPGPIAGIFWMDEELCSELYLDAIITVADAKYCKQVCTSFHTSYEGKFITNLSVLPKTGLFHVQIWHNLQ